MSVSRPYRPPTAESQGESVKIEPELQYWSISRAAFASTPKSDEKKTFSPSKPQSYPSAAKPKYGAASVPDATLRLYPQPSLRFTSNSNRNCPWGSCRVATHFTTVESKHEHVRTAHAEEIMDRFPGPCAWPGCVSGSWFPSSTRLIKHVRETHLDPKACSWKKEKCQCKAVEERREMLELFGLGSKGRGRPRRWALDDLEVNEKRAWRPGCETCRMTQMLGKEVEVDCSICESKSEDFFPIKAKRSRSIDSFKLLAQSSSASKGTNRTETAKDYTIASDPPVFSPGPVTPRGYSSCSNSPKESDGFSVVSTRSDETLNAPQTPKNLDAKASPFSPEREDLTETCEEETCLESFDESEGFSETEPEVQRPQLSQREGELANSVMLEFWDLWNKDWMSMISQCAGVHTATGSASFSTPPTKQNSSQRGSQKHNLPNNDDDKQEGKRDRAPKRPKQNHPSSDSGRESPRFSCPYRKHNPRKYNMHQHKTCALSPFDSVARVKEHMYRRHRAPPQCIRCWLFFKDQSALNIHLSAVTICTLRSGVPIEGITPDLEKKLRSRKKSRPDETEEERWGAMYALLFPGEDVPTAWFEPVSDDAALSSSTQNTTVPLSDYLQQVLPALFRTRLEDEISTLPTSFPVLAGVSQRREFTDRIVHLLAEAQVAAIGAYRNVHGDENGNGTSQPGVASRISGDNGRHSQNGSVITPPASEIFQFTPAMSSDSYSAIFSVPSARSLSASTGANNNRTYSIPYSDTQSMSQEQIQAQIWGFGVVPAAASNAPLSNTFVSDDTGTSGLMNFSNIGTNGNGNGSVEGRGAKIMFGNAGLADWELDTFYFGDRDDGGL